MSRVFEAAFTPDAPTNVGGTVAASSFLDSYLSHLLAKWGGTSFNAGMYRVISMADVPSWAKLVESTFPAFAGRLIPFGFDWLGRLFALDLQRVLDGAPAVTLFEPGTGEVLETPCTAQTFHEVELIEYREEALAASFYHTWISEGGALPTLFQCVAYRIPLFLGGTDTTDNLELADLKAYWGLAEQLIRQTRSVPIGTVVQNVVIRE